MKRTSLIGPLILITLGLLFLWINLSEGLEVLDFLALQWPWILVAWGVIRLGELLYWSQQPQPLPAKGLSGGEWFLVILICGAGSGLSGSRTLISDLGGLPVMGPGLRMFGDSYDFSIPEQTVIAGKNARVLVENLRGEVIISSGDAEKVLVSGRESLRALSEADARETWQSRQVTVEKQGDLVVVRTNQEGLGNNREVRTFLQIKVPRNCNLETRGRDLRTEVSGLTGTVDMQADVGDAQVTAIQGGVHVRLGRSREIRLREIEGPVDLASSRGDNLDVESIRGSVVASGSYGGNIQLRQITGTVRLEDRRVDLRAVAIPGEIVANRAKLTGRGITGPLRIASESKDVELDQFTGKLELSLDRGDARLRQAGPPIWPMEVNIRRGKVTLLLPPDAPMQLDSRVRKGEITNRLGRVFTEETDGDSSRIRGGVAGAPAITVNASRIELEPATPTPQ